MLRLRNVRKTYGTTVALDGLSLEVRPGEVLGLLGPNGAGKTTAVSLATGLLSPDAGTIEIDGKGSPQKPEVRGSLGVAPQALALYDDLTGEENLRFFGKLQGLSGARLAARVDATLAFVGLSERRRDRVATYSGGMKRRLNLAVAMIHEPPLLILDEPTVGVDPQSRHAILEGILALKREGRTVVYTTHYMEEAQRLCDRVAIVDRGRAIALGTVEELCAAHGGKHVIVAEGADGASVRRECDDPLQALAELGRDMPLRSFRLERADLESAFLNLTGRSLRD